MHTTNTKKGLKIFSQKDWLGAVLDESTSVEVYAKNISFDAKEIEGDLVLRGEGCCFLDLVTIKGNLSIDAEKCSLPSLKTVEGNFTMHCLAELDQLEKVKGNFKCIVDFDFKNLGTIGGDIVLKNAVVNARNKRLVKARIIIPINHQYQVDFLPKDGIFNVDVFGDDITFPHQEIRGKIKIYGKNISFPNLEFVHGSLHIECRNNKGYHWVHHFPVLKKMIGNLRLEYSKVSFPQFSEIMGNIYLENCSYADFPMMEKTKSVMIKRESGARFPVLKEVEGDLQNYGFETCYLTALQKVKGHFYTMQVLANNMMEVGDLSMNTYCEFDHLKIISGTLYYDRPVNFKSLMQIGNLINEKLKGSSFPSLERIDHYLYDGNDYFEKIAKKKYFKVTDNIYITMDYCFLSKQPLNIRYHGFTHSIKMLVSILKLRHSSFQNFMTREYEREWANYSSPYFIEILNKIEKLWNDVKPLPFEEFFKHYDRDFRLFCFSYVGVGTLMKKLQAKKINEHEVKINYFEYDENGNETKIKRTNYYEVHEVENEKMEIYGRGRTGRFSYAVKCWCPSTKKEHWLWIEPQYKDNALTAIASTFRIHENIIPHIKCLKRQGDLLICELKKEVVPSGLPRPLTASEYFSLLEVES